MTSLFGVPLTSIMVGLLLLMGLSFLVLAWIAWRNPLLVRMGLRNIARRRAQTVLIVMGLMLSTLIVSAAFATGDTVGYSITNTIYNNLQQVDFIVSFPQNVSKLQRPPGYTDSTFLQQLRDQFANNPQIDGVTGTTAQPLPVLNPTARLSAPSPLVVGVDPKTVDPFEGLRDARSGDVISASTLTDANVYVSKTLADKIDAAAGDSVQVFFQNQPHTFHVLGVVQDTSLTNQGGDSGGLVMTLDQAWALTGEPGTLNTIEVSLQGGTRGTLDRIPAMETQLQSFIDQHPESGAHIDVTKKDLVNIGTIAGSVFVTIFLVFGLFSMAAGILLIFLIFVMLAAERRSEMGMARAVGMNRLHLTEMFIAEGMAYNIGAALVGALLGLGVAWLLIFALGRIFSSFGLTIAFHVSIVGFVISYAAGVVVTFATVAFASWRAANLNIVRAIRDLPEPQPFRSSRPSLGEVLLGAVGGIWYVAWFAILALGAVAGFALFVFSLGFYGVPFVIVIPVVGLYVFGLRALGRPWSATRGRGRALYILWWLLFTPAVLVAPLSWFLVRTHGWAGRHRNAGGWAFLMLVVGLVFLYLGGWVWGQAFAYTGGTTLAVLAIAMLAVYFGVEARPAFTTAGLLLVWYWLLPLPFSLFSEAGKGWSDPVAGLFRVLPLPGPKDIKGQIEMFFVSGVSITASATLVVIFNATALLAPLTALGRVMSGVIPAVRTAIAYPLAARFRTAMTLSMFGLVVFSLVVMAFLNYNFTQLFLGDTARAGFDVRVVGNPSNRVPDLTAALQQANSPAVSEISDVGKVISATGFAQEQGSDAKPLRVPLVGADQGFFQAAQIPLARRAAGYNSDQAVLAAVQRDPSLVIASESMLKTSGGGFTVGNEQSRFSLTQTAADLDAGPWQPIDVTLTDADTGQTKQVHVIGFMQGQVTGVLEQLDGIVSTEQSVAQFTNGGSSDNFFLVTKDHSQAATETIAKQIESSLLERGVQADSIRKTVADATTQSSAFDTLFEGFMSLGLIVGIAALGVIAFRTVVERRQQIGMLRAIGYSRRLVGLSFFLESSFIALTGIVMGLVLGWALSFNLLGSPDLVGSAATKINFRVPWLTLLVIVGVAYGASALMTIIPARTASRVSVAEALRYE